MVDVPSRAAKVYAYPPPPPEVEAPARKNPPIRPNLDILLESGLTEEALRDIFFQRIDAYSTLVLADYMKGPHSKMHLHLYQRFKEKIGTGAREVIIAPRASAKSTAMTLALPLWAICYRIYRFMVICSDTSDQAEDFLSWIQEELESNDVIRRLYPHVFGKGVVWRNDRIITRNDILVRALGSSGKIRGRRYKNFRPGVIYLDDVENKQMIESDTLRKGLITWFDQDVCKAGARGQDVDIFVAGTILHRESLLNQLYEGVKYTNWSSTRFQAIESWCSNPEGQKKWEVWKKILINRYDPRRELEAMRFFLLNKEEMLEGTKVLWEDWDTYYSLMYEMVVDGELAFYRERQNIPQSPNEQIFRHLVYYKEEEFRVLTGLFSYALYLDSSLGKATKKHDFSSITVLAKHHLTNISFVRKCLVDRIPVSQQVALIVKTVLELNREGVYPKIGVESNAFQSILGDELKKKLIASGARYEKFLKVHHSVDKSSRIESLEPFINNGTIRLREGDDQELVTELTWYPQGHDDAIDSLEGAYSMLNTKVFTPTFVQTGTHPALEYLYNDSYSKRKRKPTYLYD